MWQTCREIKKMKYTEIVNKLEFSDNTRSGIVDSLVDELIEMCPIK
jgi:hypothetical protein